MLKRVLALGFVAILFMGVVAGVNVGFEDTVRTSANAQVVENESWTVNEGTVTTLDESNRDVVYSDEVTVRQSGTVYEANGNYSWIQSNGTIRASTGSDLTDGSSAEVTYDYSVPSEQQRLQRDILMFVPGTVGETLIIVLGASLLLGAVALMAGAGGY